MKLAQIFGTSPVRVAARRLYAAVVAQSRRPRFYTGLGVPDTATGRFDMIALHGFLIMHRLKAEDGTADLARALCEALVDDIDRNLREMGTGDLSVGRKVKGLTQGFYGRMEAYENGLAASDEDLMAILLRNIYGGAPTPPAALSAMTGYLRREADALAGQPVGRLAEGRVRFGPPPGEPADNGDRQGIG